MKFKDLTNKKFNRLTVLYKSKNNGKTIYYWCKCDCGKKLEIRGISLTRKDNPTRSCGCLRIEEMHKMVGNKNPAWKGGERIETSGYIEVYLPNHPLSRSNGYIKKHRVIMEKHIGRYLLPTENVHHTNGNKSDNRIENLELWNTSQPCGQRVEDKIKWAKEILKIYKNYEI